jgi:hypothetical protein
MKLHTAPLDEMIRQALESFCLRLDKKESRRLIPRTTPDGKKIPYLYRGYLEGDDTPDGQCGLFLHKFVASDESDKLHSHPWVWSVSFILSGSYRETRSKPDPKSKQQHLAETMIILETPTKRTFEPGQSNFIGGNDYHSVEILTKEVWTLFLHGPRNSDWGFVPMPKEPGIAVPIDIVKVRTRDRPAVKVARGGK